MKLLGVAVLGLSAAGVRARCPNDCNGNGECNPSSICECWHGYAGSDCSQRLCTFAKAYTDTPLGDLNSNEELGVSQQVHLHVSNAPQVEMYSPHYGLARSDITSEWNEAHFYRECANKGLCDRKSGQCDCFPGFEGEGCQRTVCPSDCSGHGQCVLLSYDEYDYDAWDKDVTQGCHCDPGYSGADCSKRDCDSDVDPEESKYIDTSTLFKIEFSMQGGKGGSAVNFFDGTTMLPNGATLFTVTLHDEFGDEYTTPASTVYYQADCSDDQGEFQPDTTSNGAVCGSIAFPIDPYLYSDDELRSLRSAAHLSSLLNTNSSFLYESSFVGEQLNNSLNALPSSAARGSLVFTAANTALNEDAASLPFIYPAYNAPDFSAFGDADPTQDATVCNLDQTLQNSMCNTDLDFSTGPTPFINSPKFRFPIFIDDDDVSGAGFTDAARRYLNCDAGSVCIFIRLDGPLDKRGLTVRYKYKADMYAANRTDASSQPDAVDVDSAASTSAYEVFSGPEMTGWSSFMGNTTGDGGGATVSSVGSIVEVTEVGSTRLWHSALDGTPDVSYNSGIRAHTCSKRGLCDYDTGLCECFQGYFGSACNSRI